MNNEMRLPVTAPTKAAVDIQKDAAERFASDTATHVMTVLHDDGLYRHLRFNAPDHGFSWFELITWPGALSIRGDHGGHVFSRTDDMFEFFRANGNQHRINPGYWAEKTPDGGRSLHEYSEDKLRAKLASELAEYKKAYSDLKAKYALAKSDHDALPREKQWTAKVPIEPKTPAELNELIDDYDEDGELAHEDGARRLLRELESADVVSDTWEWDLSDWNYHYLWCCHAIVAGIAKYDAHRKASVTVEIPGVSR